MNPDRLDDLLRHTLADRRLSRGERRALEALIEEHDPTPQERALYLARAFEIVHEVFEGHAEREILGWLHELARLLLDHRAAPSLAEVRFAPHTDCNELLRRALAECAASAELCVFTLTDDTLTRALLEAHRRGVGVRVISDDDKSLDPGSDLAWLSDRGIQVRTDAGPEHMHHKFAIFDARRLASGSFNWTRSASRHNYENVLLTDDSRLVAAYREEFERLWTLFGSG